MEISVEKAIEVITSSAKSLRKEFRDLQTEYSDVGASDSEIDHAFNYVLKRASKGEDFLDLSTSLFYKTWAEFWQLYSYNPDELDEAGNPKQQRVNECAEKLTSVARKLHLIYKEMGNFSRNS